jgi:uncharacterized repeat protein (TIGR01451 family)
MTNQPNYNTSKPRENMENFKDDNSIEQFGRALLRQSAKKIRHAETTKMRRISAGSLAMVMAAAQVIPAFASINNTVTASGTAPGNVAVNGSAGANVGVVTAAPSITVVKTAFFKVPADDINGDGLADVNDKISYTYLVTNTGNVTVHSVGITDANDGVGTAPAIIVPTVVTTDAGTLAAGTQNDSTDSVTTDTAWENLGPGDAITFESSYTVVAGDITGAGGGTGVGLSGINEPDGYLDNTVTASASYTNGATTTTVTAEDTANKQLKINNELQITKTPDITTGVTAGTTVTYTYVVTNNGNTPITGIVLHDTHNGVLDALTPAFQSFTTNTGSTNSGNTITLLQPGDVAVYTATYVVQQSDIDIHQ